MPTTRSQRGVTLIEAMVAMVVLLVGAIGMVSLHSTGVRLQGEAREVTRATAIAQDLMNQIQTWEYADARLANANASNDADPSDDAGAFALYGTTPPFDHAEADLTAGRPWTGIPTAALATGGFERYWNVSTNNPDGTLIDTAGNGVADGMRVAVIVRWLQGASWHRVVLHGYKVNPGDRL
jgi:prepilin-type N-terminal cleavage/methylation domain-containing protein